MQDNSIKLVEEKQIKSKEDMQQTTIAIVGGIACPIDPQERLECEACQ